MVLLCIDLTFRGLAAAVQAEIMMSNKPKSSAVTFAYRSPILGRDATPRRPALALRAQPSQTLPDLPAWVAEMSYGPVPSIVYGENEAGEHGNFLPASYRRILQQTGLESAAGQGLYRLAFSPQKGRSHAARARVRQQLRRAADEHFLLPGNPAPRGCLFPAWRSSQAFIRPSVSDREFR